LLHFQEEIAAILEQQEADQALNDSTSVDESSDSETV